MAQLHIGFMRQLKNNEFATLVNEIADLLRPIETEEKPLKDLLENIQTHSQEMYYLNDETPADPLTEEINRLAQERTDYLISLRLQVDGKRLSHKSSERLAANNLYRWLQTHKKYLYVAAISPQNSQINSLLTHKKKYPIISSALIDLNLEDLFEAILDVTEQLKKVVKKRYGKETDKAKSGKAIRKAAYNDMQLLANLLNVMTKNNPPNSDDDVYYEVSKRIGSEMKRAHTILKSRLTKRDNLKNWTRAMSTLICTTTEKENGVTPNKKLSEMLSEGYLLKEKSILSYSETEIQEEVKNKLLVKGNKQKEIIGKDWNWKLPKIVSN